MRKDGIYGGDIHFNYPELHTPCYIIEKEKFLANLFAIRNNFQKAWGNNLLIAYSIKTNHLSKLLELAKEEGMLAEAVSEDEYYYATKSGFNKNNIILNGPQKSPKCIVDALQNSSIINIDNLEEINMLEKQSKLFDAQNIKIGLRINFDLEKECRSETTAGEGGSRFGLCIENGELENAVNRLSKMNINISGLHLHYSTKTRSLQVFKALAEKACGISERYGLRDEINYIDIGGGFWGGRTVEGKPTMQEYSSVIASILKKEFDPEKVRLILEPGASLLATTAVYYSKVINVRKIRKVSIATIDGSLLHVNPFMVFRKPDCIVYSSGEKNIVKQLICGCACMENDRITELDNEKEIRTGDYVQINYVGAYTMGFNNCFINLPPYIYFREGGKMTLLRDKKMSLMLDI